MPNLKHAIQYLYLSIGFYDLIDRPEWMPGNVQANRRFMFYLFSTWPHRRDAIDQVKFLSEFYSGVNIYVWVVKWGMNAGDDAVAGFAEKGIIQSETDLGKIQPSEPATQYLYPVVNLRRVGEDGIILEPGEIPGDPNNLWGMFPYSVHSHLTKARPYARSSRRRGYSTWIHKWEVIFGHNVKTVTALAGF